MKITKYKNLISVFFGVLFISYSCSNSDSDRLNEKPNFVFIFADDHSFNTLGVYSDETVITPNLDKLSEAGLNFTHTYNMGGWNGAVCIASRTMLMTGKYIWNAFKADSIMKANKYDTPMWSELMEEAGYETYMSGKWHVKKPANEVFNHVTHVRPGMPNQTEEGYNRPLSQVDTLWRPWDKSKEGFWKGGKHWSEVLADDALAFLDSTSTDDKPFFMYLAFNAPHDPRQSPKSYVEKYPLDKIGVPENFLQEYPFNEAMGSGRGLRDERLAPFPRTEYSVQVNRQEYYAIISHMDEQIGRILNALKESGKMDNTYIIFTADHGLSVGQHGLLGKQNMYDHSMRVPMIIVGPDMPVNKSLKANIYLQDIVPTVLEIANIKKPEYIDFHSLIPIISGGKNSEYPMMYGAYTMNQRMVKSNDYKLIAYPKAAKLRLFDLKNDPNEMNDLADVPAYYSKRDELFKELLQLQKEMNDPLNLESYFPKN